MSASDYHDQIQKLYIAYFNRPADPLGLAFWSNVVEASGGSISAVSSQFSASPEFISLYGGKSSAELVSAVYQNLFGREPEPAGLLYWSLLLDQRLISLSNVVTTVMAAAQGTDITAVENKLIAATLFTNNLDTAEEILGYSGADALAAARAFLNKIDATDASLANLEADTKQAVIDATGVGKVVTPPTDTGTSTPTPPPPFKATLDSSGPGVVTFENAGTIIYVEKTGSSHPPVYTFTTNVSGAGSSTVSGYSFDIDVPLNKTLNVSRDLASSITFTGQGAVSLSDSDLSVNEVIDFDMRSEVLVKVPNLAEIAGALGDVKLVLEAATLGTQLSAPALSKVTLTNEITAGALDDVVFANDTTIVLADVAGNSLTLPGGIVASGKTLTIDGALVSSPLTLNASAVTGSVTLIAGSGGSTLYGGKGADTLIGGAGDDNFVYSFDTRSKWTAMDTIEDYRTSGTDVIVLGDVHVVAATINVIQEFDSTFSDVRDVLNAVASGNSVDYGLSVFIWGGDTYVYLETVGSANTYSDFDYFIKLAGLPFASGTAIAGLGISGI